MNPHSIVIKGTEVENDILYVGKNYYVTNYMYIVRVQCKRKLRDLKSRRAGCYRLRKSICLIGAQARPLIASRTNDVMTQTRLRQTNWNGG